MGYGPGPCLVAAPRRPRAGPSDQVWEQPSRVGGCAQGLHVCRGRWVLITTARPSARSTPQRRRSVQLGSGCERFRSQLPSGSIVEEGADFLRGQRCEDARSVSLGGSRAESGWLTATRRTPTPETCAKPTFCGCRAAGLSAFEDYPTGPLRNEH